MLLEFTKMHGLGNDFVVIDLVTQSATLSADDIARMADRHTGVGFDQMLVVEPPTDPEADFRYRIFNADGSEAEQCGNGARCFTRFVHDRKLTMKPVITLQTNTGLIECRLRENGQVDVDMGEPCFEPAALPCIATEQCLLNGDTAQLQIGDTSLEFALVSMGNPHAILFCEDIFAVPVTELGPAIQALSAFPEGVNVGFCQLIDRGFLRLRVFERGAGETRACGSGACAAVAAARRRGWVDERVKVSLPGGKLRLSWQGPGHHIRMLGDAVAVFEGRIES
ncbi:MAG: diaminopimelate epimerase [Gammaproteobacteria bacterium]|nr:MAG: diaminopimelate epimerase [Gammaproteobacteria bacterium]